MNYNDEKTIEQLKVETGHLFQDTTKIFIPKKLEYNLSRYVSKKELKKIDSDLTTAIELCLLVVSQLNSTLFSEDKYKALNSTILQSLTSTNNSNTYKKILELMIVGTKTGSIIEVYNGGMYTAGVASRQYKLGEAYLNAGLTMYTLTTEKVKNLNNTRYWKTFNQVMVNPICSNVAKFYGLITLPTVEEVLEEGKRLVKEKYRTKKGKLLTMLNKNDRKRWKDANQRSFVEDGVDMFTYLTSNGFILPIPGDYKSGGRVVDSLSLMPSWIRNMITINGVRLTECDYTCLHPNLAVNIYGGDTKFITHKKVAEFLDIDVKIAKIEHLSFFNKQQTGMEKSELWNYYMENETNMMANVLAEKETTNYRRTSARLFEKEVELMTNVISQLNNAGVYVGYVYDALVCEAQYYNSVCDIMDKTAAQMNIFTKVGRVEMTEEIIEVEPIVEETIIAPQIEENEVKITLSDETLAEVKAIIDGRANLITNWEELTPLFEQKNITKKDIIIGGINRDKIILEYLKQLI